MIFSSVDSSTNTSIVFTSTFITSADSYVLLSTNFSEWEPKFKSNEVYNSAKGMIEGMGYEVRYKTLGPLVTTMADYVVKH